MAETKEEDRRAHLCLSRRVDEEVVISHPSGDVVVRVERIIRNVGERPKVRIGFTAPKSVMILRREVAERQVANGGS